MTSSRWIVLVVVVGAVGYAGGRYAARTAVPPGEAQERAQEAIAAEETRESQAEEVVAVVATETQERVAARRHRVFREGPIAEETIEVEASRATAELLAEAARVETEVEVRVVEVERLVDRLVKVPAPLPDWRIGVVGGLDIAAVPGLAYGGSLERRVWGPVSVGLTVIGGGGRLSILGTASADLL